MLHESFKLNDSFCSVYGYVLTVRKTIHGMMWHIKLHLSSWQTIRPVPIGPRLCVHIVELMSQVKTQGSNASFANILTFLWASNVSPPLKSVNLTFLCSSRLEQIDLLSDLYTRETRGRGRTIGGFIFKGCMPKIWYAKSQNQSEALQSAWDFVRFVWQKWPTAEAYIPREH